MDRMSDDDAMRDGEKARNCRNGFLRPDGHVRPLEEVEREAIGLAIRRYEGNLSEAARRLGSGRSTLYRRLGEQDRGVG